MNPERGLAHTLSAHACNILKAWSSYSRCAIDNHCCTGLWIDIFMRKTVIGCQGGRKVLYYVKSTQWVDDNPVQ